MERGEISEPMRAVSTGHRWQSNQTHASLSKESREKLAPEETHGLEHGLDGIWQIAVSGASDTI
jgi:hypothetical protein